MFFILADAFDEYFVDGLKPGDKVSIHVLYFGILSE
jgi:hypothetical protein